MKLVPAPLRHLLNVGGAETQSRDTAGMGGVYVRISSIHSMCIIMRMGGRERERCEIKQTLVNLGYSFCEREVGEKLGDEPRPGTAYWPHPLSPTYIVVE